MTPPRSRASGYRIGAIASCSAKRRWSCRRPAVACISDADAHQPLGRGGERLRQPAGHHALGEQLLRIGRPEARHRGPAADAEVAQPARPVLEVGFEKKDRVAEPAVTRLLLGAQARHEVLRRGLGDPGPKRGQELVGQRAIAGQEARVEQRRRGRQVVGRQRQRLVVGSYRVPGVDLGVPQRIQDRLGELLHVIAGRLGAQHQQIEIGERRQLAAAKAAGGEDGHGRLALRHLAPRDVDDDRVDFTRKDPCRLDARVCAARTRRRGRPLAGGGESLCNAVGHFWICTLPEATRGQADP